MLRFPYEPRPHQEDIIQTVTSALANGKHVVMESGTGTGKTVCTLFSSLKEALATKKRVIYTTRTNSQQQQVISETRSISQASGCRLSCVGLQGRNNFCLLLRDLEAAGQQRKGREATGKSEEEEAPSTLEELAAYCSARRRTSRDKVEKEYKKGSLIPATIQKIGSPWTLQGAIKRSKYKGCIYYENLLRGGTPGLEGMPNGEEEEEESLAPPLYSEFNQNEDHTLDESDAILQEEDDNIFAAWLLEENPTTGELLEFCQRNKICPYELCKLACRRAEAVVVPYIFFFAPYLRHHLLEWMNAALGDVILIVDEAHNLPDYARELQSSTLSRRSLQMVVSELEKFTLNQIAEDMSLSALCQLLDKSMDLFIQDYLVDEDGLIPDFELEQLVLGFFRMSSPRLKKLVGSIVKMGVAVKEKKLNQGQLPSSHIYSFGNFLLNWMNSQDNHFIHLITKDSKEETPLRRNGSQEQKNEVQDPGESEFEDSPEKAIYYVNEKGQKEIVGSVASRMPEEKELEDRFKPGKMSLTNPRLEIFCLDPSITTEVIGQCRASVHMSGTLRPMDQYLDSIGLPADHCVVRSFPSPFPRENRRYYFLNDVTTRYADYSRDPTIQERIDSHLREAASLVPGRNAIFFFPSFRLQKHFSSQPWVGKLKRPVFVERQGIPGGDHQELIRAFRESGGGLLFSVMGGRTSEGIDFPGEELQLVLIVGIPYPRPSVRLQALQFYNEQKFGKGYFYTFHAPASRKLAQALGRLIRTEEDRGLGFILDRRAHRFKDYIFDLEMGKSVKFEILSFDFDG